MSPRRLLRRVTLSLVGRLPTEDEQAAVEKDGLPAMDAILDDVMQEDAFYERLREAFNDILLTEGYDGNAETRFQLYAFPQDSACGINSAIPTKIASRDDKLTYSHSRNERLLQTGARVPRGHASRAA